MNTSLVVSSLKSMTSFYLISSLSSWIYQELVNVNYTDDKLIKSINDIDVLSSIIHMNQDKTVLTNLLTVFCDFDNYSESTYRCAKLLLEHGADVNIHNGTLLYYYSKEGYTAIVKLLLDHGANIHIRNESALLYSCINGHLETIKVLIYYGADIHFRNDCILTEAVKYNREKVVLLLLNNGANADNNQALTEAIWNRNIVITKMLIDHGANVNSTDGVPLVFACYKHSIEIVCLLLESGAIVTDFILTQNNASKEISQLLVEWKQKQRLN